LKALLDPERLSLNKETIDVFITRVANVADAMMDREADRFEKGAEFEAAHRKALEEQAEKLKAKLENTHA